MSSWSRKFLLEVIACSVEDAIQAERGGAGRLEIVSHLEAGGLTPSLPLVHDILAAVSIPVRVMLRENDGFETRSNDEVARLCAFASELSRLRVEGIVLGFLREGLVDGEAISQILACAKNLKATFHHAFDAAGDQLQVISKLKEFPQIDRILTRGSEKSLTLQISNLIRYEAAAQPEIQILAGGGLDASRVRELLRVTPVYEFHVGRAAREPAGTHAVVTAERVREIIQRVA